MIFFKIKKKIENTVYLSVLREKEPIGCINIYREIYCKELAHMITEARECKLCSVGWQD